MSDLVLYQTDGDVAILTVNNPRVNALSPGVPEGIAEGRTGFVCDTVDEMAALVARLPEIDRHECRREAERRFSDQAIVDEYEKLYRSLI